MTVKECYDILGGDYADALRRFVNEERMTRFLFMLKRDNTFYELSRALEARDITSAFRAAHTLKGILLNLGLKRHAESASILTEELRDGKFTERVVPLYEELKSQFSDLDEVVNALMTQAPSGE